jgi:hypothetical protein
MSDHHRELVPTRPPGLVDVLDRILDKGLVVVGDIKISLAEVELLTLKIRLLICSVDKAEEIGINWWRYDTNLSVPAESSGPPVAAGGHPPTRVTDGAAGSLPAAGLALDGNGNTVAATRETSEMG